MRKLEVMGRWGKGGWVEMRDWKRDDGGGSDGDGQCCKYERV